MADDPFDPDEVDATALDVDALALTDAVSATEVVTVTVAPPACAAGDVVGAWPGDWLTATA